MGKKMKKHKHHSARQNKHSNLNAKLFIKTEEHLFVALEKKKNTSSANPGRHSGPPQFRSMPKNR